MTSVASFYSEKAGKFYYLNLSLLCHILNTENGFKTLLLLGDLLDEFILPARYISLDARQFMHPVRYISEERVKLYQSVQSYKHTNGYPIADLLRESSLRYFPEKKERIYYSVSELEEIKKIRRKQSQIELEKLIKLVEKTEESPTTKGEALQVLNSVKIWIKTNEPFY
jgi:hypothetical protein